MRSALTFGISHASCGTHGGTSARPSRPAASAGQPAAARRRAERCGWCPPLGLDEDELDEPGYRPYSRYREATGTGTAGEFVPRLPAPATGGAAGGYQTRHYDWSAGACASSPPTPANAYAGGLGGRRT